MRNRTETKTRTVDVEGLWNYITQTIKKTTTKNHRENKKIKNEEIRSVLMLESYNEDLIINRQTEKLETWKNYFESLLNIEPDEKHTENSHVPAEHLLSV